MKIKAYNIDWGRYKHELPEETVLELSGNWFNWFADDEKVKRLNAEVETRLKATYGFTPQFFICKEEQEEAVNGL